MSNDPAIDILLYRKKNANNIYEYSFHATMVFDDTAMIPNGYLVETTNNSNTLDVTLIVINDVSTPSKEAATTVHHTRHVGVLPFGNQEGTINLFLTVNVSGGAPEVVKKPKGHVTTESAEEEI